MNQRDEDGQLCIEVILETEAANYFVSATITENQEAVLRIYAATVKTAVIKRDTDVLTKDEEIKNWKMILEAMLEELKIWVKYQCFRKRLRKGVRNLMGSMPYGIKRI